MPGFEINAVYSEPGVLEIEARSTATSGDCPNCRQGSGHLHGWHQRHPQELPSLGQTVRLTLQVRRFRCMNGGCGQQTCVEQFPEWLPAYARRTIRLTQVLREIAFQVGGEAGKHIVKRFKIVVSGDTMLRIIRQTNVVALQGAKVIGIDDWAIKRGRRYGTLVVDLERHRAIDVLPERTAKVVTDWLKQRPEVAIVARDRSTEYAAAIQAGAPQAIQVADRWHLLLNVREMVDRLVSVIFARLQQLPVAPEHAAVLRPKHRTFRRTHAELAHSEASRQRRVAQYEQIQRLRRDGFNMAQIVRLLNLHPKTVRTNFHATSFPERKQRPAKRSMLDPFVPYLERRVYEGCENALQLWREVKALGYPGTGRQIRRWMDLNPTRPAPNRPVRLHLTQTSAPTPPSSQLPSAKVLSWLLVLDPDQCTPEQFAILQHILQVSQLSQAHLLVQHFVTMVRQHAVERLDPWLAACAQSSLSHLRNFALGVRQHYAAVRAALLLPFSNGQTQGQLNRLKFIKRQMYGRAHFDLLRLRVLWHSPST
jgi:transposase